MRFWLLLLLLVVVVVVVVVVVLSLLLSPLLFSPHASSTFLLSPLPTPPNKTKQQQQQKLAPATQAMIGPTLERWVKARKQTGGDEPGAGETKVCSCYTDSSIMRSKMRKSRHLRNFNGMMQN